MMFENIKYAYFDLDGTLVSEGKTISDESIKAINYLKSKGIKVGLATGRSPYFASPFKNQIVFDLPFVCINGAQIIDKDNNVLHETLFPLSAYSIFDLFKKKGIMFLIYSKEGVFFSDLNHPFYKRLSAMIKTLNIKLDFVFKEVQDLAFYKNHSFYKLLITYQDELEKKELESFIKSYHDVAFASSQWNVLDIFSLKADKAYGIEYVVKEMKASLNDVIVFGDNENDVKMFQTFPNSVALINAKPDVKKHAKFITNLPCSENGVADFILKNF